MYAIRSYYEAVSGRSGTYMVSVTTEDGRAVAEFQGLSRSIGGSVLEPKGD